MGRELVLVIDDSPTITKVVQLVLTKVGYEVVTAGDGEAGLDAARLRPPSLILLDFVMPKMNGYQFCRELNADPALKDIPVVLMSAKGDQVGERFVKVMGIVDYITKPFSPEAISAVVTHAITKFRPGLLDEASHGLVSGEDLGNSEQVENAASRELAFEQIRQSLVASLQEQNCSHAHEVISALSTEMIAAAMATVEPQRQLELAMQQSPALIGDLRTVPLAEVLHLLDTQAQTGILTVWRGEATITIYFRRGKVDQAVASNVPEEFLLGRFVTDKELMTTAVFEQFVTTRDGDQSLIGRHLVALGHISDAELRDSLTRQTAELIYEILRWRFGRFRFASAIALPPTVIDAALGIDIEGVLMEGYRRVDEWHLIEHAIDNFEMVFLRNEDAVAQMGRGRLTREELSILELVNGKNNIKDIVRKSRMGSFDVSKMLYRLLSIRLLRKRVQPVAT
jgi:DNA-binding response OmpR family regulator